MDMEITSEEVNTIRRALESMTQFEMRPLRGIPSQYPFAFKEKPTVPLSPDEAAPQVHAVAEIFGITFTQGKNSIILVILSFCA